MAGFEAFSSEWAVAWRDALNASEGYRRAAASWQGTVALVMHPDGASGVKERRAVFLDPSRGRCTEARVASDGDLASAAYVFEATADVWRELLVSHGSPILALMTGRLSLTRGSMMALLPFAGAANELMSTAAHVPTEFSAGA